MPVGIRRTGYGQILLTLVLCLSAPAAAAQKGTRARRPASGEASRVQQAAERITAVRFWSLGDTTRVAIETSGEFTYKYDRLSNPDRYFFDLSGVAPAEGKLSEKIAVEDGLVQQIRIAKSSNSTTRVVIDLAAVAEVTASQLSNPDRLIIEVRQSGKKPASDSTAPSGAPVQPPPTAIVARISSPKSEPPSAGGLAVKPASPGGDTTSSASLPKSEPPPTVTATVKPAKAGPHAAEPSAPTVVDPVPPKSALETPPATPKEVAATKPGDPVAQAAKRTASGERSMTRVLGLKLGRIVLDPGHGGHDSGTHGPTGLQEKDLVLDVSKRLGDMIAARLGAEVIFTRDSDAYVPLEERTRIANRHKADLFLSVHANSSPVKGVSGIETYYLNFTSSKAALEVAARENASSERSIYDLKDLLQKIALSDKLVESREFAERVQTSLSGLSARSNANSRNRGVKKAPFIVLIGASMPSVLVEIGFVTNPGDEVLMKKPEYRQKIAEAIYKGVAQYAAGLSHTEVAKRKSTD